MKDQQVINLKTTRHVLGISGGKDSAALAIYLKEHRKQDNVEYFFCDTGAELKEVYEYLDRLEDFLGTPIARLSSGRDFDHWLKLYGNYLPSAKSRWCTRVMKLEPFEQFVGDDPCVSYIGIRADENRSGYISSKPNIKPVYPFVEDGLEKKDIFRLLEESGVGIPEYYNWRSRSGCYFCFFQRKEEWVGLKENHPDLFEKAKSYEKVDQSTGRRFTWAPNESLEEIEARAEEIRSRALARSGKSIVGSWQDILTEIEDDDDQDTNSCLICSL